MTRVPVKRGHVTPHCAFTPKDKFVARSRCRPNFDAVQVLSGKFVAPHLLPANCASCQFILNHGRDDRHCMSLPVLEEGETSENQTQSIHNIVMTTEEAVNEVLIRQRFIRYLINRWNTQDQ